jgi:Uma2 family endonuclease
MSTQARTPPPRMNVEEYLVWSEGRQGRYELVGGEVVAQASERAAHWKTKLATHVALLSAIRKTGLPCHVVPDGGTVRIDDSTAFEPDGMVYCGKEVAPSSLIVENPVIIFEALFRSTGSIDKGRKLVDYFRLPSLEHYLIVDCDEPLIIHHQRRDGGDILTRIVRDGVISLDPPGIELPMAEVYDCLG